MNYSELYKKSSNLHPGSPIEVISDLLHKAGDIHAFDRTRLFHVVARQTNTSVGAVESLYLSEPIKFPTSDDGIAEYQTHEDVINVLKSVYHSVAERAGCAQRLKGVISFLEEQERLGAEALDESIEAVGKGPVVGADFTAAAYRHALSVLMRELDDLSVAARAEIAKNHQFASAIIEAHELLRVGDHFPDAQTFCEALEPFMAFDAVTRQALTAMPDVASVTLSVPARAAERLINLAVAVFTADQN